MLKIEYKKGDLIFTLSLEPSILETLKQMPSWKLPREDKSDNTLMNSFYSIYTKSVPLIQEYQMMASAKKLELEKELVDNGSLSLENGQFLTIPGKFSIVRSIRLDNWKIKVSVAFNESLEGVISSNASDYTITVLELDNKTVTGVPDKTPMIRKGSLIRDLNKNRPTAGTKKIDAFAKEFNTKFSTNKNTQKR